MPMPDRMSEYMQDKRPNKMPKCIYVSRMPKKRSKYMSNRMPEYVSDKMPDKMSERMTNRMLDRMPGREWQIECQNISQNVRHGGDRSKLISTADWPTLAEQGGMIKPWYITLRNPCGMWFISITCYNPEKEFPDQPIQTNAPPNHDLSL